MEGAPRGGAGKLSLRSCDGDVMLRLMHGASWVACVLAVCTVCMYHTSPYACMPFPCTYCMLVRA